VNHRKLTIAKLVFSNAQKIGAMVQ
jgi:hypothetical protein